MNLAGSSGVEEETRSACDVEVDDIRLDRTWLLSRGKRVLMARVLLQNFPVFSLVYSFVCVWMNLVLLMV